MRCAAAGCEVITPGPCGLTSAHGVTICHNLGRAPAVPGIVTNRTKGDQTVLVGPNGREGPAMSRGACGTSWVAAGPGPAGDNGEAGGTAG